MTDLISISINSTYSDKSKQVDPAGAVIHSERSTERARKNVILESPPITVYRHGLEDVNLQSVPAIYKYFHDTGQKIKNDYEKHKNQKFQKTSKIWYEGLISFGREKFENINDPELIMQKTIEFCDLFEDRTGGKVHMISLHTDEGHNDAEGKFLGNYHAHFIFSNYDDKNHVAALRNAKIQVEERKLEYQEFEDKKTGQKRKKTVKTNITTGRNIDVAYTGTHMQDDIAAIFADLGFARGKNYKALGLEAPEHLGYENFKKQKIAKTKINKLQNKFITERQKTQQLQSAIEETQNKINELQKTKEEIQKKYSEMQDFYINKLENLNKNNKIKENEMSAKPIKFETEIETEHQKKLNQAKQAISIIENDGDIEFDYDDSVDNYPEEKREILIAEVFGNKNKKLNQAISEYKQLTSQIDENSAPYRSCNGVYVPNSNYFSLSNTPEKIKIIWGENKTFQKHGSEKLAEFQKSQTYQNDMIEHVNKTINEIERRDKPPVTQSEFFELIDNINRTKKEIKTNVNESLSYLDKTFNNKLNDADRAQRSKFVSALSFVKPLIYKGLKWCVSGFREGLAYNPNLNNYVKMQEKARKSKIKILRIKEKNLREIVESRVLFIDSVAPKYEALQRVTNEYKSIVKEMQHGKIKINEEIQDKITTLSDKISSLTNEVDRYNERIAKLDDHLSFILEEIRDLDVQKFTEIKQEIQQFNQNRNNQNIEIVR